MDLEHHVVIQATVPRLYYAPIHWCVIAYEKAHVWVCSPTNGALITSRHLESEVLLGWAPALPQLEFRQPWQIETHMGILSPSDGACFVYEGHLKVHVFVGDVVAFPKLYRVAVLDEASMHVQTFAPWRM